MYKNIFLLFIAERENNYIKYCSILAYNVKIVKHIEKWQWFRTIFFFSFSIIKLIDYSEKYKAINCSTFKNDKRRMQNIV